MDLTKRHPGTTGLLRYFAYDHLPEHLRSVSPPAHALACQMARELPDGPELTAGLRKLLEAKDCFARAALDASEHKGIAETAVATRPPQTF